MAQHFSVVGFATKIKFSKKPNAHEAKKRWKKKKKRFIGTAAPKGSIMEARRSLFFPSLSNWPISYLSNALRSTCYATAQPLKFSTSVAAEAYSATWSAIISQQRSKKA